MVDAACKNLNIPLYLIGAQARHFHLAEQGIKPGRGTMDIDFAIMFPDMDRYETLKNNLLDAGFRKVTEPYRMIHDKTNTVIDLLPFGEIEEKSSVKFMDRKTEISVVGLKEIVLRSEARQLDEEMVIQVTPLAGIILLKLISFDEKPERSKDLDDIHEILIHYFDLNSNRFYEILPDNMDDFDQNHFTLEAGAWLAGYDIGQLLASHYLLKNHILRILEGELKQEAGKISRYFYNKAYFEDIESVKRILDLMTTGINQSIVNP